MKIRNAVMEDAQVIGELSAQLGYPTSTDQTSDRLGVILESNEHVVLVASLDDGSVVGWLHIFLAFRLESEAFAELGGFVVEKQHRHQGIGKRLLEEAEQRMIQFGIGKLRIRTRSDRTEARVFYQRNRFSKTKEQHVYDKKLKVIF